MACGITVDFVGTDLCTPCGLPGDGLWSKTRWRCWEIHRACGATVHTVGRNRCGTTGFEPSAGATKVSASVRSRIRTYIRRGTVDAVEALLGRF